MQYIYEIENLNFQYPQREKYALKNISLNISKGDFVLLMGLSGCGKSTLLKHLKSTLMPHGNKSGVVKFNSKNINESCHIEQIQKIGYVSQNPDNQIVTDKVWHELAFSLESLGYSNDEIRIKVSEIASFFGIHNWFHKNVDELSGGQKQLLNLAAVMTTNPDVLILDEPTSQLDPVASQEFLDTLKKINNELGITIILSEQRLEDAFPLSNHIILIDDGEIILNEKNIKSIPQKIKNLNHPIFCAIPTPAKLHSYLDNDESSPITINEGQTWFYNFIKSKNSTYIKTSETKENSVEENEIYDTNFDIAIELDDIYFKYEDSQNFVLKGLSAKIKKGDFFSILGGNGSGKSTTLSIITGINTAHSGKVFINGENIDDIPIERRFKNLLAFLPQNPQDLFVQKKVIDEINDVLKTLNLPKEKEFYEFKKIIDMCKLQELLEHNPYDLSGGEQQRVALAKILLLKPKILLLDEPTKGLDGYFKTQLSNILKNLQKSGITIIMVSHDIEFCAENSSRCAMFFDGNIITTSEPVKFFSGNRFYTTATNKIVRNLFPQCIIEDDVLKLFNIKIKNTKKIFDEFNHENFDNDNKKNNRFTQNESENISNFKDTNPINLKYLLFGIFTALTTYFSLNKIFNEEPYNYILNAIIILETIITLTFSFPCGEIEIPCDLIQENHNKRNLQKRTILASIMILLIIPLTIYFGIFYLNDRKYMLISLLMILEILIPFILIFENKKPQAKEFVIIAVLVAIAVASRSAFFMLQNFKPLMAIVIISGVCLGGEVGFLVGATSMLISNIFMGQGPWTPWQMLTAGIIGFLSGVLFKKGLLRKKRNSLCIFGFVFVFIIHFLIMNFASVAMWYPNPTKDIFIAYYIKGLPFDLIYATATSIFLWFFSKPMIEKLERIKTKYGILK